MLSKEIFSFMMTERSLEGVVAMGANKKPDVAA